MTSKFFRVSEAAHSQLVELVDKANATPTPHGETTLKSYLEWLIDREYRMKFTVEEPEYKGEGVA